MNLKQIRQNSGLKVKKIADELGISREHYYNLENGTTKLSEERLYKLSQIFQISIQEIKRGLQDGKTN